MAHVIGIVHEENGTFGISFPDFPGAVSTGRSMDEAIAKGAQVLAFHVEGMVVEKEALPELRSLEAIAAAEPEWIQGGIVVAVPVELPGRSVRINISVDEHALERIDRAAKAAGMTRSGFLVSAAMERARAQMSETHTA